MLKFILLVAVLTLSASGAAIQWTGPGGNGHFYNTTVETSWADAQFIANANGGHLVTISSQAEQDFLVATFGSSPQFWIGLSDEVIPGTFQWVNGEPLVYTNWHSTQPDNGGCADPAINCEAYVSMNFLEPGKWNDNAAPVTRIGIYEIEPAAVPEPSSVLLILPALAFAVVKLARP